MPLPRSLHGFAGQLQNEVQSILNGQEYAFAFVRDISERRGLETQLRQAQKLEAFWHLSAGIAHEINVARNERKYVAQVEMKLDESLPLVLCYPGDINQVILNLLVNSAHAIKEKIKEGEKGLITVGTQLCGDFAEISVADTGAGIPEEIRNRIFDPFFTTKEVGKGTGQGLSLAHAVITKNTPAKSGSKLRQTVEPPSLFIFPSGKPIRERRADLAPHSRKASR